jgi:protein involved in polysaccharide export with SLBB domain
LQQFGYNVLGVPSAVTVGQAGAVQDNYVLGVGDEIVVVLRGQENATYRQRVNRDGQVIVPRLPPLPAAGRTFAEFRQDLEAQVGQAYVATNAFVSLGETRQISVLVTGEVQSPGLRTLSALATPMDALLVSGGVQKTGSLRNVALIRGNNTTILDLYSILAQANAAGIGTLREGDRIYVPPLGNTVAVTGLVRRPGIYELASNQGALDANALIALAGGIEIAGIYRLSKMQLEQDGSLRLVSLPVVGDLVRNGEILFVDPSRDVALGRITLGGAAKLQGDHPLAAGATVGQLIRGVEDLSPEAYTPFAVIVRRDPVLNVKTLAPFALTRVLAGAENVNLQNDDLVYVFTRDEIRLLADAAAREEVQTLQPQQQEEDEQRSTQPGAILPGQPGLAPGTLPLQQSGVPMALGQQPNGTYTVGNVPVSAQTALGGLATPNAAPDVRLRAAQQELTTGTAAIAQAAAEATRQQTLTTQALAGATPEDLERASVENVARRLGVSTQAITRTARDHLVWVLDEVRDPGSYMAADHITLSEMIQTAGGLLRQADLSSVEVTSTAIDALAGTSQTVRTAYRGNIEELQRVTVLPLDVIRLRPVFSDRDDGRVTVTGQARYPGSFDITRGERLSSVLERAGGLTPEAYPYGAIFTRQRAAIAESEGNIREARAIESQLTTLAASPNVEDRGRVTFLTGLAQQLREAPTLGRIMVTADPAVLSVRPELDIIMEPGDTLYIPKRPSTVTVSGEVLNNGSFQYQAGLATRDYLQLAGGTTQEADDNRIFVVLPDGSAQLTRRSWLTFANADLIPPGSTIIVPRDLQPFNLTQFLRDATQITSQLAVTAASIAVIGQ